MPAANSATHPATKSGNGSVILDIPITPTWWGHKFLTQERTLYKCDDSLQTLQRRNDDL